jgi:hypothetical protein
MECAVKVTSNIRALAIKALGRCIVSLSCTLLAICPAEYARADSSSDTQLWSTLVVTAPIDSQEKFSFYGEVQPRFGDDVSAIERLVVRPGLTYKVTDTLAATIGYAYTPLFLNNTYDYHYRDEQRVWEQLAYTQKLASWPITFNHRFRQEQRFIDDTSEAAHRTRYLLKASIPFHEGGRFGATGNDEVFFNWNSVDHGPRAGFDRNRIFSGIYYEAKPARIELGYLSEFGKRFSGSEDRFINALALYAFLNF